MLLALGMILFPNLQKCFDSLYIEALALEFGKYALNVALYPEFLFLEPFQPFNERL